MTRERFAEFVQEGMERIPPRFQRALREMAVVVVNVPTRAQRQQTRVHQRSLLLGLYEGTPRTERQYAPYLYPEKITLFQRSFERLCGDDDACFREEVAATIWHELGHALGIGERRIRELERALRRRRMVTGSRRRAV